MNCWKLDMRPLRRYSSLQTPRQCRLH